MSKALEYYRKNAPNKLIIKCDGDLTDTIILSALVRDIHKCYAGLFVTDVVSKHGFIISDAPYIKLMLNDKSKDVTVVNVESNSNTPLHRIQSMYQDFNDKTGLEVTPTELRGEVFVDEDIEFGEPLHETDYWILSVGEHDNNSVLDWDSKYFNEVKEYFDGRINFVEVDLNTLDEVGEDFPITSLIYHSSGIICTNDAMSHLSSAIKFKGDSKRLRPCVVIGGGHQSPTHISYAGHQYLNTIGMLPCCKSGGCQKTKIIENGDDGEEDDSCDYIARRSDGEYVSKCMSMINQFDVIRTVERYLSYSDV